MIICITKSLSYKEASYISGEQSKIALTTHMKTLSLSILSTKVKVLTTPWEGETLALTNSTAVETSTRGLSGTNIITRNAGRSITHVY
jgi:hypothetical protein